MDVRLQPEIRAFVDAGLAFCQLVVSTATREAWLTDMLSTTLALYTVALALPDGQVTREDEVAVGFAVSQEELQGLWQRLGDMIGADRWYGSAGPLIDSSGSLSDLFVGDLVDDLADIYRDLTPGLRYWQTGTQEALGDVVWEWKFGFTTHWGSHAIAALGALHHLVIAGLRSDLRADPPEP